MLTTAGLHVPLTPLTDVVGKTGTVLPAQMICDVPKLNVAVSNGLTVTVNVASAMHCSGVAVGVKL